MQSESPDGCDMPSERTSPGVLPEQRLWAAVIVQAMRDARRGEPVERDRAVDWIQSGDFLEVCDLAGLPALEVRRLALEQVGTVITSKRRHRGRLPRWIEQEAWKAAG